MHAETAPQLWMGILSFGLSSAGASRRLWVDWKLSSQICNSAVQGGMGPTLAVQGLPLGLRRLVLHCIRDGLVHHIGGDGGGLADVLSDAQARWLVERD